MDRALSIGQDACGSAPSGVGSLKIWLALAKPRLTALVVLTTGGSCVLAANGASDWPHLLWTLLGTALAAGGANAANQWAEHRRDARMRRTCDRPLPRGRLSRMHALLIALAMLIMGAGLLAVRVNGIAATLALVSAGIYVLAYTPLKARSSLCTLIGAVSGAIPPMLGWAAVSGRLDEPAWVLGGLLYVWQVPHFLSLAWLHREDYASAGVRALSVVDPSGRMTAQVALLHCLALLPIGLGASLAGIAGRVYMVGSLLLGAAMLATAIGFYHRHTNPAARRLFLASLFYLPLLFALMLADRGPIR